MRDENLSLIEANMFLPEDQRKPMMDKQEQLLKQVTDCYNLQLQKPMASRTYLRNNMYDYRSESSLSNEMEKYYPLTINGK